MEQAKQYETIFKRKSIRKYEQDPLEESTLTAIADFVKGLKPLFADIKTQMNIVGHKDVKILMPIKAPHYLMVYAEKKEGYLTQVGYMLQQVDLFLSANGIGSCYLGMAQPAIADTSLEFVMILAFGHAKDAVHRANISEFNRKELSKITDISNLEALLEPVRLAPSASNGQPWFFTGDQNVIHAFCNKPNMIKALLYEKMNKVDMGIALYHLEVAAA
ncbi:MAG: nitroreductase, partial [Hyphomonadaceae bacterium]|nr:nitroreductase [Clostridia bacterium]